MHALWGSPVASDIPGELELRCPDVRTRDISSLPSDWEEMLTLLHGRLQPKLMEWVDQMWKDLLDPEVRDEEK